MSCFFHKRIKVRKLETELIEKVILLPFSNRLLLHEMTCRTLLTAMF